MSYYYPKYTYLIGIILRRQVGKAGINPALLGLISIQVSVVSPMSSKSESHENVALSPIEPPSTVTAPLGGAKRLSQRAVQ